MKSENSRQKLLQIVSENKALLFAAFLFAVAASVASVLSTYYIGKAIDVMVGEGKVNFALLFKILGVLAVIFAANALLGWLVAFCANRVSTNSAKSLRIELFAKLNNLPISYFDKTPHGDVVSTFIHDTDNIADAISLIVKSLFPGIVIVVSAVVVMFSINPKVTIVVLITTPISFIIAYFTAKFSRETFAKQQAVTGKISGFVSEIVGNQKQVFAFGRAEEVEKQFETLNKELFVVGKKAHFAGAIINPVTRFVDHLSYTLVGLVGGLLAIGAGVSAGTVSSFLIFSSQFAKPFNELSGIMGNIQAAFASLDRICGTLEEKEESADLKSPIQLKNIEGKIEFSNVSFSYNKKSSLIKNLDLQANAGSLVAIVGPTGAGKSTLINLLMRFHELDSGKILLDGSNITRLNRDDLRASFGMVLQDTWLFSGTIRDNIIYGNPNASDEEVLAASESAYANSFIKNLINGYYTDISDGDILSEGEKQLISIARVMLADPKMLILDEATSSIDTLTEQRVQKAFQKLMKGRTSFVVAHRLSTIAAADLILVMDKGTIVEQGTHEKLLAKKGFYNELYRSQFA